MFDSTKQAWAAVRGDGCTKSPDFAYTRCCNRHDKDYSTHTDENGKPLTRKQADKRLYDCMRKSGKTPIVGRLIVPAIYYAAVRTFGGKYWKKQNER